MRWRAPGWRSRRGNAAVLLLLGLLLADLVPRVRLLVGRRCLVLGPVELLLTLLSRRAVRMFRTAGYGAGAAAVIRSAIHRSVIHRPSLRRRPRSSRSFLSSLFFPLLSFFLSLSFSFSTSTCASSSLLSYIPARPIVRLSLSLSPRGQTRPRDTGPTRDQRHRSTHTIRSISSSSVRGDDDSDSFGCRNQPTRKIRSIQD